MSHDASPANVISAAIGYVPGSQAFAAPTADLLRQLGADVTCLDAAEHMRAFDALIFDLDSFRAFDARHDMRATAEGEGGPVMLVVSPFGLTGPLSDAPASEIVLQAWSGLLATNGYPNGRPIQVGVPVGQAGAAMLGAAGLLAALIERVGSGRGQIVDLSAYDCLVNFLGTLLPTLLVTGKQFTPIGNRHAMTSPWNSYPTRDGWVIITTMGDAQWHAVLRAIDRVDLLEDSALSDSDGRVRNADRVDGLIADWTRRHTTDQAIRAMHDVGVPAGPIRDIRQLLASDDVRTRGLATLNEGVCSTGSLFRVDARDESPGAGVPQHPRPESSGTRTAPLHGVRVLEFGSLTAGPLAGRFLAQLGAEVVKVEPPNGERSRHLAQRVDGTGYLYYINNTGKDGLCLDLHRVEDRRTMQDVLRTSDIFVTNVASDTLAKLQLSPADAEAVNATGIYAAITGYGQEDLSRRAFDMIIQAESGIMHLTGDAHRAPLKASLSIIDIFTACSSLVSSLACVYAQRTADRSGQRGYLIDAAMLDAGAWLSSFRWNGRDLDHLPSRIGNASEAAALQGVFATTDGRFIAITISSADQIAALRAAGVLDNEPGRGADACDEITEWVRSCSMSTVLEHLAAAGIAAAPVQSLSDVLQAPHTTARNLVQQHPGADVPAITVLGTPFKFSATPVPPQRRAPTLGEHNARFGLRPKGV